MQEKARGPQHVLVAAQLASLGSVYNAQGRYGEAEPLFRRALAIGEKASGSDHASVGSVLNSLGFVAANQGRYAEADALYKRSPPSRKEAAATKVPKWRFGSTISPACTKAWVATPMPRRITGARLPSARITRA